jgi:hypothetical protein
MSGKIEYSLSSTEPPKLDRPGWAWEFLRRNPNYISATAGSGDCTKRRLRRASAMSVIDANDCAVEQRDWGLCFRGAP